MGLVRTEALVLRTVDFAESTQIAHFFSPTLGKFSAIARGVKRMKSRLGPRLEAFSHVEVSVYTREGATMGTLSSIELLQRWMIFRRDLKAHAMAALVVESIDRGIEEGKTAAEIFRVVLSYLRFLDGGADVDSLTAHTLLRLVCLLGFAPDMREARGREGQVLYLNPEDGRLQAAPPGEGRIPRLRLEGGMREWMRQSMSLGVEDFSKFQVEPRSSQAFIQLLVRLIEYDLEVELRSLRFVEKMIWSGTR